MPIMIQTEPGKQQKKSKTFLASMFKRSKDEDDAYKGSLGEQNTALGGATAMTLETLIAGVCPVSTSMSVHAALDLMPCSLASTLTLTPGRTRNLDQDMEALRLSRQDNPFLQLLASRESLLESDDCNDAAILMSNVCNFVTNNYHFIKFFLYLLKRNVGGAFPVKYLLGGDYFA